MHAVFHDRIFIQIYGAHVQEMDHLMLPFLKQNVTVCAWHSRAVCGLERLFESCCYKFLCAL